MSRTIIFKPVGNKCNKHCRYCWQSDDCLAESVDKYCELLYLKCLLEEQGTDGQRQLLVFHGGEPLLMGKKYAQNCLELVKQYFQSRTTFQIQTNGTLLDKEWLEIFRNHSARFDISVSLDPVGQEDLRFETVEERNLVLGNIQQVSDTFRYAAVVSVMHKKNIVNFPEFIDTIVGRGVKYLTINKYSLYNESNIEYAISELDYVNALITIAEYWISRQLYRKIQIQPLMCLITGNHGRLCQFNADNDKCDRFVIITPDGIKRGCEHKNDGHKTPLLQCKGCDIEHWCGGGCPSVVKDNTFCQARHSLKRFVERIKR